MNEEIAVSIIWGVVAVFAIHGWFVYLTFRLFVTGRGLFGVKTKEQKSKIVGWRGESA